jgi:LAO/AO transport system kinase
MGLDGVWKGLEEYRTKLSGSGEFQEKRNNQRWKALWSMLQDRLMSDLRTHPLVMAELPRIHDELHDGRLTVTLAMERILDLSRR